MTSKFVEHFRNLFFKPSKGSSYYDMQSQVALPFAPTPDSAIEGIMDTLEQSFGLSAGSKQRFIDLGAGNGKVVFMVARRFRVKATGVEINDQLIREANHVQKEARLKGARVVKGDLFQQDLAGFDFVFIFSLPDNQRFLNHVFQTARPGTIIVAYRYALDELPHLLALEQVQAVQANEEEQHAYFYRRI
jgi:predicted O-methyltransferase YrrM